MRLRLASSLFLTFSFIPVLQVHSGTSSVPCETPVVTCLRDWQDIIYQLEAEVRGRISEGFFFFFFFLWVVV